MKKLIQTLKQKWAEYLFEIIVIVIGILIAYSLNNWNDARKAKIEETKVLINIRRALTEDIIKLREFMAQWETRDINNERLLRILEEGTIYNEDSLNLLFGAAYNISVFQLNVSPFESLKSKGIELITNDSISILIIEVYESGQKYFESKNDLENNVMLELIRPYYMNNFFNIRFAISATPNDLKKVLHDKYYWNIVDYSLTAHILWKDRYYQILSDMVKLKELIDERLDE